MYCENCDIHFEGGDYCPECGTKIEEPYKDQSINHPITNNRKTWFMWTSLMFIVLVTSMVVGAYIPWLLLVVLLVGTFLVVNHMTNKNESLMDLQLVNKKLVLS
jgi:uncharacterized membrane protein YvbJ